MNIDLSKEEIEFIIRALVCSYAEKDSDYKSEELTTSGPAGFLIGKLCCTRDFHRAYNEARNEKYSQKASLNKELFLGNGWHSQVDCNNLHKRLEAAFAAYGIIEQNGGMETQFNDKLDRECKKTLLDFVKDILVAFNLKDIDGLL